MATETFIGNMRGPVIRPMDADYDAVRSLYNGMIDKSPAIIARCTDVADVVTAVNFARQNDLKVAIRGGGHNGPGLSSVDDGLMIDMSMMKGVRVNPAARTVRVGPGCTQGDVDHATHIYGLAVPAGIVSTTGIAGLTLGGGTGYLTRKHGLTIDNLLEADVVLADGCIVTANKSENADLYWGLRGGGGNFGIVTSFLFLAHPVNMVYADRKRPDRHAEVQGFSAWRSRGTRGFCRIEDGSPGGAVPGGASGQARLRHYRLLQWPDGSWPGGHGEVAQ
jgi:FAD/FMN-containing dehydrogenase